MKTSTRKQFQEIGDFRQVLEGADRFILLSLDPNPEKGMNSESVEAFHDYRIVGKALVSDPARRTELIASLYDGIAQAASPRKCFIPHHGIRAVQGEKTLDLVICFICRQVRFYFADSNKTEYRWSVVAVAPVETFDRALAEAGIPLWLEEEE